MIAIPAISSEYERVFNDIRWLITFLCNCLKKDIIVASKCLDGWYKQKSAKQLD